MARLVVFKDPNEIVDLRDLLYGNFNQQKRGLSKAKAYQIRGHLPPSVHATCLLISAVHSDVPSADFYAIRQTYAMALIRFVNEMLDVYQVGRAVVPLHILASQMGLPSAFVELRHAATHEDLPSINLLRNMANRALGWLMDNFWSKQRRIDGGSLRDGLLTSPSGSEQPTPKRLKLKHDLASDAGIGDLEISSGAERVKELLRSWRRLKRSNPAATPPEALLAALENEWENDEGEFLDVCLNKNVLVPTTVQSHRGIAQIVPMWLPLFQSMSDQACEGLASVVAMALSGREWPVKKNEEIRPWNAQILAICATRNGSKDLYQSAEEMASLTGTDIVEFAGSEEPQVLGWRKVKNWTPRPIGT